MNVEGIKKSAMTLSHEGMRSLTDSYENSSWDDPIHESFSPLNDSLRHYSSLIADNTERSDSLISTVKEIDMDSIIEEAGRVCSSASSL